MRPLWRYIILVFTLLTLIFVAAQFCHAGPAKEYYPGKSQDTWVKLVNWLMDQPVQKDNFGNVLYGHSFTINDDICALSFNQSTGILTMTIVQTGKKDVRIIGKGYEAEIRHSTVVNILSMISFNQDTIPDMAIEQEVAMEPDLKTPRGLFTVLDMIPQEQVSPREKDKFNLKLRYLSTWALWEVSIMEGLGFKMVLPEKKEKL